MPSEPGASPSSCETRCAKEIADIRLGSVQKIFTCRPFASSFSSIIVGVCVDLPLQSTISKAQIPKGEFGLPSRFTT